MPLFTFEVARSDGDILLVDKRDLPGVEEIWGHLETIAIQLRHRGDLLLRVKDPNGGNVVLTGIANVIVSLERCRRTACPIKDLLAGRDKTPVAARAPCMSISVGEIPWLDLPDSLLGRPIR